LGHLSLLRFGGGDSVVVFAVAVDELSGFAKSSSVRLIFAQRSKLIKQPLGVRVRELPAKIEELLVVSAMSLGRTLRI
jgi:hypothetical protein